MQPFRDEPLDDGDWPKAVAVVGNAATPNPVRRVAVVGVLAVLAAAVVAASSSDLLSRLRGEVPALSIRGGGGVFMAALLTMMLLAVVGLGYLSWVERAPRRRGGEGPVLEEARPQRWIDWWPALLLPLLVVSLITLLLALGELFGRPVASESPPQDASQPGGVPLPGAASGGDGTDWPVHWLVFAVLASVGGTVAGVLLVRDWRRRRREARSTAAGEELIVAIEESLADLEGEPDPRLAVIKAYGRMERALARAGTGRLPPETPLEYLARVLAAAQVSRASITRLTSLFQRAQFSRHAVDAAMKRQAIDALHDLRGELEHPGVPGATR